MQNALYKIRADLLEQADSVLANACITGQIKSKNPHGCKATLSKGHKPSQQALIPFQAQQFATGKQTELQASLLMQGLLTSKLPPEVRLTASWACCRSTACTAEAS